MRRWEYQGEEDWAWGWFQVPEGEEAWVHPTQTQRTGETDPQGPFEEALEAEGARGLARLQAGWVPFASVQQVCMAPLRAGLGPGAGKDFAFPSPNPGAFLTVWPSYREQLLTVTPFSAKCCLGGLLQPHLPFLSVSTAFSCL